MSRIEKLVEVRHDALDAMQAINEAAADRDLTDDESAKYEELRGVVVKCDEALTRQREIDEKRENAYAPKPRAKDVKDEELRHILRDEKIDAPKVTSEAPTYAKDGERSWFKDLVQWKRDDDPEARDRIKGFAREEARERRDLSLTDSAGGYVVPPAYMIDDFVELRRQLAPALSLCTIMPHPGRDEVRIPKMSTGTAVAVATENNTVQETDAVLAEIDANNYRIAGKQDLSNRLLDFSTGFDSIILRDLGNAALTGLDAAVVTGSGSSEWEGVDAASTTGSVTYTDGTPDAASLYPKLLKAIQEVHEGAYEAPNAWVMHPQTIAWLLAELDGSSRPFLAPVGAQNAYGNIDPRNLAGTIAGIPVVSDTNIPTNLGAGTNEAEILLGAWQHAIAFLGVPKFAVSVDEAFSKDQTTVRVTQDMIFTSQRVTGAFQKITGTGLAAAL